MSNPANDPITIDRDKSRELFLSWHETDNVCEQAPSYYSKALVVRLYNEARADAAPRVLPLDKTDANPSFSELPQQMTLDYKRTRKALMFWHKDEVTDEKEAIGMGDRLIERMRTEAAPDAAIPSQGVPLPAPQHIAGGTAHGPTAGGK